MLCYQNATVEIYCKQLGSLAFFIFERNRGDSLLPNGCFFATMGVFIFPQNSLFSMDCATLIFSAKGLGADLEARNSGVEMCRIRPVCLKKLKGGNIHHEKSEEDSRAGPGSGHEHVSDGHRQRLHGRRQRGRHL